MGNPGPIGTKPNSSEEYETDAGRLGNGNFGEIAVTGVITYDDEPSMTIGHIKDGTSNTILAAEMSWDNRPDSAPLNRAWTRGDRSTIGPPAM
jgi:hypothetical protein